MASSLNGPLAQHLQQLLNGSAYSEPDPDTTVVGADGVVRDKAIDRSQGTMNSVKPIRDSLLRELVNKTNATMPWGYE